MVTEAELIEGFRKEGISEKSWSVRSLELQRGVFSSKLGCGSASVRRGDSCYLGMVTAEIGMVEKVDSLVRVSINCPTTCDFMPSTDSTGLSTENLETNRLAYIDCVATQVERILLGIIEVPKISPEATYTWVLKLSISCLSYDGNLFDNALITGVVCLMDMRLAPVLWDSVRKWWYANPSATVGEKVTLKAVPVPLTRVSINGKIFFDPNSDMASVGWPSTDVFYFSGSSENPASVPMETVRFIGIPKQLSSDSRNEMFFSMVKRIHHQLLTQNT